MRASRKSDQIKYFSSAKLDLILEWIERFVSKLGNTTDFLGASSFPKGGVIFNKLISPAEFVQCVLREEHGEFLLKTKLGGNEVKWHFAFRKKLVLEIDFGQVNSCLQSEEQEMADSFLKELFENVGFDLVVNSSCGDWKKMPIEGNLMGLYFWEKLDNLNFKKLMKSEYLSEEVSVLGDGLFDLVQSVQRREIKAEGNQSIYKMDSSLLTSWAKGIDELLVDELGSRSSNERYATPIFRRFIKLWMNGNR